MAKGKMANRYSPEVRARAGVYRPGGICSCYTEEKVAMRGIGGQHQAMDCQAQIGAGYLGVQSRHLVDRV